jgi:hypothetical protein
MPGISCVFGEEWHFHTAADEVKIHRADGIIYSALVEYELNLQDEMIPRARDAVKVLGARGNELLKSLEDDVQGRLWKSERSDGTGPPSLPE